MITSQAAGKCGTYRWMYICDFSRSVREGHDAENLRADPLSDPFDGAAFAGGVASPENDADLRAGDLDSLLQGDEFAVQDTHLPLVVLGLHLGFRWSVDPSSTRPMVDRRNRCLLPSRPLCASSNCFAVIVPAVIVLECGIQLIVLQPACLTGQIEGPSARTQYNPRDAFVAV